MKHPFEGTEVGPDQRPEGYVDSEIRENLVCAVKTGGAGGGRRLVASAYQPPPWTIRRCAMPNPTHRQQLLQ